MSSIKSSDDSLVKNLKQLLFIDPAQILLYLVTSFLILALLNIRIVRDYFVANFLHQGDTTNIFSSGNLQKAHHFWVTLSQNRFFLVLFWVIVGILVYIIIWLVENFVVNLYNDIVADEYYVHPSPYNRSGYWESIMARKIFLLASVTALLGYLFALTKVLPLLSKLFYAAIFNNFALASSPLRLAETLIGAGVLLYVLTVLIHIVVNAWKVIYRGL